MHDDLPDLKIPKADPKWKIAIVRSLWHEELTGHLATDAKSALMAAGIKEKNIKMVDAPGSFEVPLLAKRIIAKSKVNGVVALGVIVQGATHHARLLAEAASHGLMELQMETGVPVSFEILYVREIADARARAMGAGAKGGIAAKTLLSTLAKMKEMRS